ncbi:MAG: class A beta-lactamase-related serine hydrolase [Oscillospiraceae bacterium]|nr:class A beta-lactamase-related serine hydrolase [Oscillospiraceae bacterium]
MGKKLVWIGLFFVIVGLTALLTACQTPVSAVVEQTPKVTPVAPELSPVPPATPIPEPTPRPTPEPAEATARENPFTEEPLRLHAQDVYYSIYYFSEGARYTNGDSPKMPAASVIKVFIMQYAYSRIEQGELSEDDIIGGQNVRRLIEGMIQQSDNTATNILIDYFGMEALNQFFLRQGFTETVLQRRMLDHEARRQGLDNYTSTRDAMAFLQRLYHNRPIYPYSEMLAIMEGQAVRTKIPLLLPTDTVVANKTGELHDVENDIGLVFMEDTAFAIVVLTDGVTNGGAVRQAIGQLARQAYEYNRGEFR